MSHSGTKTHILSTSRLSEYLSSKKSESVLSKICTANKVLIEKNRKYVSQLIDLILFLSKQGIAFRGHKETSESTNKGFNIFKYFSFFNEITL